MSQQGGAHHIGRLGLFVARMSSVVNKECIKRVRNNFTPYGSCLGGI
jgi:hypothetical protein